MTTWVGGCSSLTAGLQGSGQDNQLVQLWPGSTFFDQPLEADYRFMTAWNCELPRSGARVAFGFEFQGATAPTEEQPLNAQALGPPAVGVQTPYTPGTHLDTSYRAVTRGSEYSSVFLQFRPGGGRMPTISLYAQEEWSLFTGTQLWLLYRQNDNAQDWGLGVRAEQPF